MTDKQPDPPAPQDDNDGNSGDRRSKPRPDPYDLLVHDDNDIIGLIAYSIFRQKKKKLHKDYPNDTNRRFFFDLMIPQYEEELRDGAVSWYAKFCGQIERDYSRKHMQETREYVSLLFDNIRSDQRKFKWLQSITSSVVATFFYAAFLIIAAFLLQFLIHSNPLNAFSDIVKTMDDFLRN